MEPISIIETISCHLTTLQSDIEGRTDTRKVNYARDMVCYFMRKRTELTLKEIGKFINNRKHNAVYYATRRIKNMSDVYAWVKEDIKTIDEQLRQTA